MTSIFNRPSAALAILQQVNTGAVTVQRPQSSADNLIAVATGQTDKIASSRQPTPAQSKVSEALFGTDSKVNLTKMKLDLIVRTGKALGVERDDYISMSDFAKAMEKAYHTLTPSEVNSIERDLGLDKLGLSLADVINSAKDPDSNDKVTRALKLQMDKNNDEDSDASAEQQAIVGPDDTGLYGLFSLR